MKPMALIVDDQSERHAAIELHLSATHDVEHAWSYTDATSQLEHGKWDVVYLDHDLADFESAVEASEEIDFVPQREMTGLDVASFIAHMSNDKRPRQVIIHSWNPAGANAMMRLLSSAGIPVSYEPFSA